MLRNKFNVLAQHLQEVMEESLPKMVDDRIFCHSPKRSGRSSRWCSSKGENGEKKEKTFEHGTFVSGESSSGQDYESKLSPSMSGNQEQFDDFDFWTDSYAIDDDELPTEKVS
ncbi:hypothetical protein Tco_0071384 [Tanacetum coccineum]